MTRKRLLVRADDVGYTKAFDLGIYKAIEEGIVTSADVMLDSPHTVEALKWLKERPWITVGWHRHLWESPVLPPEQVPSLVDEEGRFKWRHNKQQLKKETNYDDCYRELAAELDRCYEVYGQYPVTATIRNQNNPLEIAMKDVCRDYRINTLVWDYIGEHRNRERDVVPFAQQTVEEKLTRYGLEYFNDYDPLGKILGLTWSDDSIIQRAGGHPGYLDDHILEESICTLHRVKDLMAVTDQRAKQFIIDNKIELINSRDVIYGTNEFQNHLKDIGSPLWIGNF